MAERGRSSSISEILQTDEHNTLGITPVLKEYVKMLCEHPSTWIDFPLADHLKEKKSRKHRSTSNLGSKPPPLTDAKDKEKAETEVKRTETTTSSTPSGTSSEPSAPTPTSLPTLEIVPPSPTVENSSATRPRRQPSNMTRNRSKSETAATIAANLRTPTPTTTQPARTESKSLLSWFGSLLRDKTPSQPSIPQINELVPVSEVKDPGDGWHMTKKQRQHALLLLKEIPQLMGMRQQLVPKHLSEDTFWRIYFLLVRNKLGHILEDDSDDDEEDNYDRTKPAKHASSWNLCHRSAFAQLFTGQSKVHFEDTSTLPISGFYPWWRANSKGFKEEERYSTTKTPEMVAKEVEKGKVKGWDTVDVKRLKLEAPNQLRKLVREGVPDDHRRMTWTYCVGTRELLQHQPSYFEVTLERVFGDAAPEQCNPIPTFGGSMLYKTRHYLSPEGISAFKRILVLLAMTNEFVEYAPLIPDVLAILLSFLPEDEAFVTLQIMIAHSEKQCRFLWLSKRDVFLACTAFVRLMEQHFSELCNVMKSCQVRVTELVEEFLSNIFLPWLPYQTVLHLFDTYMLEGAVVLIRIGLGIFSACSASLMACTTRQEFMHTLGVGMSKLTDSEALILGSFKDFKLKHSTLSEMYRAIGDTISQTHMNNNTVLHTPKVSPDLSKILTKTQWETLWYWLPHRYQIEEPKQLFSTASDGYNLNTLVNKCSTAKPQILLVKTQSHCIFGVFVTEPWPRSPQEHFFGNGESFLFSIYPKEVKYSWRLGNRSMFMLRHEDCIAVGGGTSGGFGFWLDQELLNGSSETCETFENEPLHPFGKDFQCVQVEAFTFR